MNSNVNIPLLYFSVDHVKPIGYHYALAKEISKLCKKGVLIIGSGNIIQDLKMIAWTKWTNCNTVMAGQWN